MLNSTPHRGNKITVGCFSRRYNRKKTDGGNTFRNPAACINLIGFRPYATFADLKGRLSPEQGCWKTNFWAEQIGKGDYGTPYPFWIQETHAADLVINCKYKKFYVIVKTVVRRGVS